MSVIKSSMQVVDKSVKKVEGTYQTPFNKLLSDLKAKINEDEKPAQFISGSSENHQIAANSGGVLKIHLEEPLKGQPMISLSTKDTLGSLSASLVEQENQSEIHVLIENLLDEPRNFRVNFMYNLL